ncbi:Sin-like protein conserved region-domain-containing protein [Gymnopilus junonius]|uniref:Sin-like protein conserved region-domain-containing protein n=1 Tax=Gymnopilus junonius TaxID=109634 RepID=A0A9P5NXG3_GYMJU|nr:Sin-like protein conserved region-domain-containing protein [Gymnopilus junonius]
MEVHENDELVSVLPIHFSESLAPNLQIHQFPLLTRPLQVPPSAALSGKRIKARIKPQTRRLEIHIPIDTRPEVYNSERSKAFGAGRQEDDREKNPQMDVKNQDDDEPRLSDVRLRSEEIPQRGTHLLGVVRGGKLHLHPINETHQFRPTLSYLDVLSRKNRRSRGAGSDSDSDEGPPPDPDEPVPVVAPKREKKASGDAKEVHVSARKSEDQNGPGHGGLSVVRREMLQIIRAEEDEIWDNLSFNAVATDNSSDAFESVFSRSDEVLECKTDMATFLQSIKGL